MIKKWKSVGKRLLAAAMTFCMVIGLVSVPAGQVQAAGSEDDAIENTAIHIGISKDNGGFLIRTTDGDKVNKQDNDKDLLYRADGENTSFVSFAVTRNGKKQEYIFGNHYKGSSDVVVTKENNSLKAVWSVDDITFTQTLQLVNTGANEHGMAYISYTAENHGAAADIKCRLLMDTALGAQDYAWYNVGDNNHLVETERTIREGVDSYDKSFYAVDNPFDPTITSYIVNASINNTEVKPYQVTFAHWASLAATVFDYTPNEELSFTTFFNAEHLTADSAVALYYDMGSVAENGTAIVAANYGVYSNESVASNAKLAVNLTAPDYIEYNDAKNGYKEDGRFTIKSELDNISDTDFNRVRVVVYTTGGIQCLDDHGEIVETSYEKPYTKDIMNFTAGQKQTMTFGFQQSKRSDGAYAKVSIKVYNVSDSATLSTGALVASNLLGEEKAFILVPGLEHELPEVKFSASSPELLYTKGRRTFYVSGDNFSMLQNKSEYRLLLSRKDGAKFLGSDSVEIPSPQITIDTDQNTMTIVMDDTEPGELPEGNYKLTFDYTDASKKDDSAPALEFQVVEDPACRNVSYSVMAVVKDAEDLSYSVKTYETEDSFKEEKDAILVFRGIFNVDTGSSTDTKMVYTGISKDESDNPMTVNNCLTVTGGSTTITVEDGTVLVDFDAKLRCGKYDIWNGPCALTALKKGRDYSLVPYNSNGKRTNVKNSIRLLWPSVGQAAQNILGFLMDFKWGEFGEIKVGDAKVSVISFGANMDLSFILPSFADAIRQTTDLEDAYLAYLDTQHPTIAPKDLRAIADKVPFGGSTKKKAVNTALANSVTVQDILFSGEKCLGFNLDATIGVPSYVDSMPGMTGNLKLNTIGDWSASVKGDLNFEIVQMQGEISIMSKNGFPIPDKIRFYVGSSTPGLMLDPFGVLWLQGAGGGIENLYNTIFLNDKIPPIRLILEAQMSVMQVISARAMVELGLTGFKLQLSKGTVAKGIVVLNKATIALDWYPDVKFMGGVTIGIDKWITGGGYIVVEPKKEDPSKYFFEFFVNASVQIPVAVPIIGGMKIASVGLGANSEKLYGVAKFMEVGVGIVYYWGDDSVQWKGGSEVNPTYPNLLATNRDGTLKNGLFQTPVYYDAETDRTLYAGIGTNVRQVTGNGMNQTANGITTSQEGTSHTLTFDDNHKSKIVTLSFLADSREAALAALCGNGSTVSDSQVKLTKGGTAYPLTIMDITKNVEEQPSANANLSYDENTKTATLAITFVGNAEAGEYQVTTDMETSAVIYELEGLPELMDVKEGGSQITVKDGRMTASIKGNKVDQFDSIRLIAKGSQGDEILLYNMEKSEQTAFDADGVEVSFDLPKDLPTDSYTLEIVAADEKMQYNSMICSEFAYTNGAEPSAPGSFAVTPVGDYKVSVEPAADGEDFDGYVLTAYDKDGAVVKGLEAMLYYKNGESVSYDEAGNIQDAADQTAKGPMIFGGHYEYDAASAASSEESGGETQAGSGTGGSGSGEAQAGSGTGESGNGDAQAGSGTGENGSGQDEEMPELMTAGFSAGTYTIALRKWKKLAKEQENGQDLFVYSGETRKTVELQDPIPAALSVEPGQDAKEIQVQSGGTTVKVAAFAVPDVSLTLHATEPITGSWKLDGGAKEGMSEEEKKNAEGQFVEPVNALVSGWTGLADGMHTVEYMVKNAAGDASSMTYLFNVDTKAPNLLVSSPLSGEFFDHKTGTVTVSGKSEAGQKLKLSDQTTGTSWEITADEEGGFTEEIKLAEGYASHDLRLTAADELGNTASQDISLLADNMGKITSIVIYADGKRVENGDVLKAGGHSLAACGITKDGEALNLNGSRLLEWQAVSVSGEAKLTAVGTAVSLVTTDEDEGIVTARLKIHDDGAYSAAAVFGKKTGGQEASEDVTTEEGQSGSSEATEDSQGESSVTTEEGQSGSSEATEEGQSGSSEATEEGQSGSSDATEEGQSGSSEATEEGQSGSSDATEEGQSGTTENAQAGTTENAQTGTTGESQAGTTGQNPVQETESGQGTAAGTQAATSKGAAGGTTEKSTVPTPGAATTEAAKPLAAGKTFTTSGTAAAKYKVGKNQTVTYVASKKSQATVRIPAEITYEGVTYKVAAVAANAFKGDKKLKMLVIGSNVTEIGKNAFKDCKKLKAVQMTQCRLKKIKAGAFMGCKKLKKIYLNTDQLKSIGKNAFKGTAAKPTVTVYAAKKAAYSKAVKKLKKAGAKKAVYKFKASPKVKQVGKGDIVQTTGACGGRYQIQESSEDAKIAVWLGAADGSGENVTIPDRVTIGSEVYRVVLDQEV